MASQSWDFRIRKKCYIIFLSIICCISKNVPLCECSYRWQILTNFQNFFARTLPIANFLIPHPGTEKSIPRPQSLLSCNCSDNKTWQLITANQKCRRKCGEGKHCKRDPITSDKHRWYQLRPPSTNEQTNTISELLMQRVFVF